MRCPLFFRIFLFCFFSNAYVATAIPLVDADAFVSGDHLAMYDQVSGLSWLDWGITNWDTGVTETLLHLKKDPKYYHWRMPTELEVRDLITRLVPITIDEENEVSNVIGDPAVGAAVTDIWGYNMDYQFWGEDYHDYYSQGFFRTNDAWGLLGFSYRFSPDETRYHVEFGFTLAYPNPPEWSWLINDVWSTLLVRDGDKVLKAPEPATMILFLLGLFSITSRRFLKDRVAL